jgi:hypothetical protein
MLHLRRLGARRSRARVRLGALAGVLAVGCTAGGSGAQAPEAPGSPQASASVASACALPSEQLLRVWRGSRPEVGGNLQIVPAEPHYLGAGFSHSGPWDYVQEIPLFFYGAAHVPARGRVDTAPTLADIAPTKAALLGLDFDAPDGSALREALLPPDERRKRPRLILTVVWDAVGRNVLDAWPEAWPNLARLIPEGVWFDGATVGSSPSNTPPTHATIGTGAFPRRHGLLDSYIRIDGRELKGAVLVPSVLQLPTLADRYAAEASDDGALTGMVATLTWHVGMLGHGSMWPGVSPPVAVVRQNEDAETGGEEGTFWKLTAGMDPYFRFPEYVNELPGIERDVEQLDRADGKLDGRWGPHPFSALDDGFKTPARTTYQARIVKEVIEREGFGADEVPDLLYVNFKAVDTIGHIWTLNSEEVRHAVQIQDGVLADLLAFLDEEVGPGEWVLVLTADHGHQFDPAVSGAFQMTVGQVARYVEGRFGESSDDPVVERVRPTQLWLDEEALSERGVTLDDVAAAILETRPEDLVDADVDVSAWPDEPVFAAAFPTSILDELPCLPGAGRG